MPRPEQELRAFSRFDLAGGDERTVELLLPRRGFAFFDPSERAHGGWRVEPGKFEIRVGSSSRDIRLRANLPVPPN